MKDAATHSYLKKGQDVVDTQRSTVTPAPPPM